MVFSWRFIWFPWLYIVAQAMIIWAPAQIVVQSVTIGGLLTIIWVYGSSDGAGHCVLFDSKVLGRDLFLLFICFGFLVIAIFYNWAGVHHLIGGPVPVWLLSAGIVASVMMVIPVIVVAINHHVTHGSRLNWWKSPTLRFVVFGAVNYTLVSIIGSTMALRTVNMTTHFTHFTAGHAHHGCSASLL